LQKNAWLEFAKWLFEMMNFLFELNITIAARGSREVASSLYRQLKSAILDGRLLAGSKLPSTRAASTAFGVSRNTAQDVFERLAQEGLVESKHGSGTFVARILPGQSGSAGPNLDDGGHLRTIDFWTNPEAASWMGFWREAHEPKPEKTLADLRPALIDPAIFPHSVFRQVMARQLRRLETSPPSSRSPQGNQGNRQLRRAVAEHIGLTRAVACGADDVLVTSGAQQGFDLIARTMVRPGETIVAVEDPGYPPLRVPFAAAGARIVPVRVDAEGIVVDEIPRDASIICVCPSHQFPLGMSMSQNRRQALIQFARRNGAVIVEDDYDGEFRHDRGPLEALRTRDSADRVFYVGSFSKCMFPSIRLGFVVAPSWAMPALVLAKNCADWHCSTPLQLAVANFILDGHLARHVRRARRIYRERRSHLLQLLETRLGEEFEVVPSFYGMHVAAMATGTADCEAISMRLAEQGIMIHALDRYFLGLPLPGFVLGFAAAGVSALTLAINALADQIAQQRPLEEAAVSNDRRDAQAAGT
jgi:GntR family transcriptional regulator/MocR family aminotransferase